MKHCETWHNTCCLGKYKDACSLCIKPSACDLGWLMSAFMSACLSVSSVFSRREHRSGNFWYKTEIHIFHVFIWLLPAHFQVLPPFLASHTVCLVAPIFLQAFISPHFLPKRESNTNMCIVFLYHVTPSSGFWHLKPALYPQPWRTINNW